MAPVLSQLTRWTNWPRIKLAYIVPRLPTSVDIQVDDTDITNTTALKDKYLPSSYRKVQTRTGHFIFGGRNIAPAS